MFETASKIFLRSVSGMSSPLPLTGDAAPMIVAGAISAMLPDRVMNVPALAAMPPAGATQTMTGTPASRIVAGDLLHRGDAAARRVQLDDDGRGAALAREADVVGEVLRHALVDDARRRQDDDLRPGAARRRGEQHEPAQRHERDRQPAHATAPRCPLLPPGGHGGHHLHVEYRTARAKALEGRRPADRALRPPASRELRSRASRCSNTRALHVSMSVDDRARPPRARRTGR